MRKKVSRAELKLDELPCHDGSVDYLTACELLEHIPRNAELPEGGNAPFVSFINERYRVLKKGGVFLSITSIFPHFAVSQNSAHNKIMTHRAPRMYSSNEKYEIAEGCGIRADFTVTSLIRPSQNLVAVFTK